MLRLNAELFQGIIAKPESWAALVVPDQGALAVRDDSGFVTMLAMKKGDRLLQANGVALSAPDDVVSAVLRPLAAQQPVRVMGTRDGQPREWLLLNAGSVSRLAEVRDLGHRHVGERVHDRRCALRTRAGADRSTTIGCVDPLGEEHGARRGARRSPLSASINASRAAGTNDGARRASGRASCRRAGV